MTYKSNRLRSVLCLATAVLGGVAFVSHAHADLRHPEISAEAPPPVPHFALTFSPIHLALPILEITGEARVGDKLGVAAVLGVGNVSAETSLGEKVKFRAYELGAQVRYYVVGDFRHGMQLGAEALYLRLSGDLRNVTGTADGLSVGPFIGYKFTAAIGFTFDAQLGVARLGLAAQATDGSRTERQSDSKWGPILNINVGWSF